MKLCSIHQYIAINELDENYPSHLIIPNNQTVKVSSEFTAYGFVAEDGGFIQVNDRIFKLYAGMYFCVIGSAIIEEMKGFICLREGNNGLFAVGGPVEKYGRLKYINGCSDTLLLSPVKLGEPCLNYLYVPPNILQTPHTHPSVRVGCVLEGKGFCKTNTETFDLTPGNIFILSPEEEHNFYTLDNYLRIVVYHPDSDFGPTHETHPMVNKTYVEGVSVRGENQYRTVDILQ